MGLDPILLSTIADGVMTDMFTGKMTHYATLSYKL